jgi:phosphate starvation-inducible PhoH-like protein|tara:strand:- start:2652 stop:3350 length:699 start_codon:yes stop_codon:yes gene_type:complete
LASNLPKFIKPIEFQTEAQKEFYEIISDEHNQIVLAHGMAGTGKTFISLQKAIEDVVRRNNNYKKVCVINPTVDVGKEDALGFLPGTLMDKIELYNESALWILYKIIGKEQTKKFIDDGKIEFRVINHMRGLNLENMYIILDEAQNISPMQIKTLLTRIHDSSKLIIQGDLSQCDKYGSNYAKSGFYDIWQRLRDVEGVEYMEFSKSDCIRSGIVSRILEKYNYNGDSIELP